MIEDGVRETSLSATQNKGCNVKIKSECIKPDVRQIPTTIIKELLES